MENLSVLLLFIGFSEQHIVRKLFPDLTRNIMRALEIAGVKRDKTYKIGQVLSINIIPGINNHVGFALSRSEPVLASLKSGESPELMFYKNFAKLIVFNNNNPIAYRLAISILAQASEMPNEAGFLPKLLRLSEVCRPTSWTHIGYRKKTRK